MGCVDMTENFRMSWFLTMLQTGLMRSQAFYMLPAFCLRLLKTVCCLQMLQAFGSLSQLFLGLQLFL